MHGRAPILLATLAATALFALPAGAAFGGDGGICFACEPKPDPSPPGSNSAAVLSIGELRDLTRSLGFADAKLAAAVAMAESSGRVRARNRNEGKRPSVDRGLFQINSRWHPEVSRACAFRARCNARAALRISDGGRDWRQWAAWHNQSYKQFMRAARAILARAARRG